MRIAMCHHLSLKKFLGGGEKWVNQVSRELQERGHDVEIYCLPFKLSKEDTKVELDLGDVSYQEAYRHKIRDVDVAYVTYNPLSWLNFDIKVPRIAGIHTKAYWKPISWRYGLLPNLANIVNRLFGDMHKYEAVHTVVDTVPINHENIFKIPNFVDSEVYHPSADKTERFTIGYANRPVWQKGYDVFEKVKKIMPDVVFEKTNNVPEEDMPKWLSSKYMTLTPARSQVFGINIVESHMVETPTAVSDIPEHRALGLSTFFANGVIDYVRAIERVKTLVDTDLYKDFVCGLREEAVAKYDKKRILDRIENMLEEVSKCER